MRKLGSIALAALCLIGSQAAAPPSGVAAPVPLGGAPSATSADAAVPAGSPRSVSTTAANARIRRVLPARIRSESKVLGSRFTMTVWDTASTRYTYKRHARASRRGASTTKILTSVGVLQAMGPERLLPTRVLAGASAREVVLTAGGDPLLTSANLRALARDTAVALGRIKPKPTASASPSSQASALGAPAAAARPRIVVRADDSLFPGPGRSSGWPSSYIPRQVRSVSAFARDDNKARNATADAGAYFAASLRALGVPARYSGEAAARSGARVLATFAGHSVAQAVSHTLLVSDNDTAEMLFRQIAVARGLPGTWSGARTALARTLAELDVPLRGVRIVDGSGLSLNGRLTAGALTSALVRALSPKYPRLAGLREWLPVAGRTGTLKAGYLRFNSAPAKCAAGRIQAKTGTVADAITLAGYAIGADGQTKVFVALVNSRPKRYSRMQTRRSIDRVVSGITGCW